MGKLGNVSPYSFDEHDAADDVANRLQSCQKHVDTLQTCRSKHLSEQTDAWQAQLGPAAAWDANSRSNLRISLPPPDINDLLETLQLMRSGPCFMYLEDHARAEGHSWSALQQTAQLFCQCLSALEDCASAPYVFGAVPRAQLMQAVDDARQQVNAVKAACAEKATFYATVADGIQFEQVEADADSYCKLVRQHLSHRDVRFADAGRWNRLSGCFGHVVAAAVAMYSNAAAQHADGHLDISSGQASRARMLQHNSTELAEYLSDLSLEANAEEASKCMWELATALCVGAASVSTLHHLVMRRSDAACLMPQLGEWLRYWNPLDYDKVHGDIAASHAAALTQTTASILLVARKQTQTACAQSDELRAQRQQMLNAAQDLASQPLQLPSLPPTSNAHAQPAAAAAEETAEAAGSSSPAAAQQQPSSSSPAAAAEAEEKEVQGRCGQKRPHTESEPPAQAAGTSGGVPADGHTAKRLRVNVKRTKANGSPHNAGAGLAPQDNAAHADGDSGEDSDDDHFAVADASEERQTEGLSANQIARIERIYGSLPRKRTKQLAVPGMEVRRCVPPHD